jgi:hypothetical protein
MILTHASFVPPQQMLALLDGIHPVMRHWLHSEGDKEHHCNPLHMNVIHQEDIKVKCHAGEKG